MYFPGYWLWCIIYHHRVCVCVCQRRARNQLYNQYPYGPYSLFFCHIAHFCILYGCVDELIWLDRCEPYEIFWFGWYFLIWILVELWLCFCVWLLFTCGPGLSHHSFPRVGQSFWQLLQYINKIIPFHSIFLFKLCPFLKLLRSLSTFGGKTFIVSY